MRLLRLVPAGSPLLVAALGLVAVPGGCGGTGSNPETQVNAAGLTPKQQVISKQMADFEASQKKGANPAPK
jgi:hypothetical protein